VKEEQDSCPEVWTNESQTDYKRQLAYRRLGISPQDVEPAPFFCIQLRRIARCINQGNPASLSIRPLDYLGFSEDPEARKVSEAYLKVPASYRKLLRPEDFCHAAGVSPWKVLEIIVAVAARRRAEASALLAAILGPNVVEKTVERALKDGGWRECLMLHKATGFVPTSGWKGL